MISAISTLAKLTGLMIDKRLLHVDEQGQAHLDVIKLNKYETWALNKFHIAEIYGISCVFLMEIYFCITKLQKRA